MRAGMRIASSEDIPEVLRLAETKVYPSYGWQDPAQAGVAYLRELLRPPDAWRHEFDLMVAEGKDQPGGFLLLKKPLLNPVTGDRDSSIRDFACSEISRRRALLLEAVEMAGAHGSRFLTVEIPMGHQDEQLVESLGFRAESYRLSVPSGQPALPENSPYEVRDVTPNDAFPIAVLAATMLGFIVSGEREYDLTELTSRSMAHTMELAARQDPGFAGLLLTLEQEMVGYLLLRLDERMGYVADVAVEPEHWGGTAVRHLVRAGSWLLHARGIPWYVGDISAANPRALGSAQRSMGFVTESRRYALKL